VGVHRTTCNSDRSLGTLINLQSGDALLIGKTVREYDPNTGTRTLMGRYSETRVSQHW